MNFEVFIEDIEKNHWNVFGVEAYLDGKLVHQYGDTNGRHPIYSATKAITSIAVGMAVDEGKLDINKSILEYLPKAILEKLPKEQTELYRHITTKRLLIMSVSDYPFRPEGESWLLKSLCYPISDVEKKEFHYSNISAYLAGVVASGAVEENLYEYLKRKLFQPLGIVDPPYACCPDGYFYGASHMELSVHELSKIGLLLYHGGVYEGKRILSEAYVREATSVQQMNREGGYGYFIWKYRNGFSISGKWKQKCYVLPEEKIMITFLSHIEEDNPQMLESMERNLLGERKIGQEFLGLFIV